MPESFTAEVPIDAIVPPNVAPLPPSRGRTHVANANLDKESKGNGRVRRTADMSRAPLELLSAPSYTISQDMIAASSSIHSHE